MTSPAEENEEEDQTVTAKNISKQCIQCDNGGCSQFNPRYNCARCKSVFYCSAQCQKKHWKQQHKRECAPVQEKIRISRERGGLFNRKLQYSDEDLLIAEEEGGGSRNTECSICMQDPILAPVVVKSCRHAFCSSCHYKWQKQGKGKSGIPGISVGNISNPGAGLSPVDLGDGSPSHCPICRSEAGPDHVVNVLVATSQKALEKAKQSSTTVACGDTDESLQQALANIDNLLNSQKEGADFAIYATKAQILLYLQRPKDALKCIKEFYKANNDKSFKATADGFGMQLLEATACIGLEDYDRANDLCIPKFAMGFQPDQFRQLHMLKANVRYKLKKYDDAIQAIDQILGTFSYFRIYPGIHIWKARAQHAQGKLAEAISTMNEAVIYETPFENAFGKIKEEDTALYEYNRLVAMKAEKK